MQNLVYSPAGTGGLTAGGSPTLIHFEFGQVRSRKDGSFETPRQLMTGSSYRITIHPEGGSAINSEWITVSSELTNAPPLRLRTDPEADRSRGKIAKVRRSPWMRLGGLLGNNDRD